MQVWLRCYDDNGLSFKKGYEGLRLPLEVLGIEHDLQVVSKKLYTGDYEIRCINGKSNEIKICDKWHELQKYPFSFYFKLVRKRANISQVKASEILGVTVSTIKNWEHDRRKPISRYQYEYLERIYFYGKSKVL